MNPERIAEYKALLEVYIRACEAMAGRTAHGSDAWINEAEHLAAKLLFHLASLLYLRPGIVARGTLLNNLKTQSAAAFF